MSADGPSLTLVELAWSAIVARRMQRQGLATPMVSIETAVSAMGGAHAQMMSAAELSIGVRVAGATPGDVRAALGPGGSLVKTYGPRGTVHVLPRDELPLWCGALGAVPYGSSLSEGVRLDADQLEATLEAIADSLASGPLDGDELGDAVVARLGAWAAEPLVPAFGGWWPRWRQAISIAAHRGILAFGDSRGTRVTYVNPGVPVEPDTAVALRWLLRRYLSTYGPATPAHYSRWLGSGKTWAAQQFALYATETESVIMNGVPSFVLVGDASFPAGLELGVTLLPHFDPYVIGSFPRELLFPGSMATRALGRGQAGVHPVLLVDGIVAGVWGTGRSGSLLTIVVEAGSPLTRSQRDELDASAERIGGFLGLEQTVVLDAVTNGAHK